MFLSAPLFGKGDITVGGEDYHSLNQIASSLGMDQRTVADGAGLELKSKWTTIEFTKDKRTIVLNGVLVHLGAAVYKRGSTFYVSEKDYESTLQPLLTPQVFRNPPGVKVIVLDAGHGGKDTGTQNSQLKMQEKHLVLDLTKRLKSILEARGYTVHLTRSTDDFIELEERPLIANRLKADLFISLHLNAGPAAVSGVETFVLPPAGHASTAGSGKGERALPGNRFDPWSALIGYYVQRELVSKLRANDRGLKRARWVVLRTLDCPGLLVEGGFLSNATEGRNLGWDQYRQRMATSIADAVDAYKKTVERVAAQQGH